jgi:hypothetical protein
MCQREIGQKAFFRLESCCAKSPLPAGARRRLPAGRNVLRIGVTEAAHAGERGHALGKGCEPAIGAAQAAILRAPRIILRLRARVDPGRHGENRQQEQQNSHGDLPVLRRCLFTNAAPATLLQRHGKEFFRSRCHGCGTSRLGTWPALRILARRGQITTDIIDAPGRRVRQHGGAAAMRAPPLGTACSMLLQRIDKIDNVPANYFLFDGEKTTDKSGALAGREE